MQDQKNRWKGFISDEHYGLSSVWKELGDNKNSDANIIARGFLPFLWLFCTCPYAAALLSYSTVGTFFFFSGTPYLVFLTLREIILVKPSRE
jgi:hypothetical protein